MKKVKILLASLILYNAMQAQQVYDPNAQKREVKDFHGIRVSGAFDVYINQSNEEAVAVSASDTKYLENIKVEVREGILQIDFDNKGMKWNSDRKKLKAYISLKKLDKLTVSGACDIFINGTIKAGVLNIKQSGASDLKGRIEAEQLIVNLSGASDMTLSGTAAHLEVDASGASDFKGFDLVTEVCDIQASGASDIKVTVNRELSAQASGASDVRYKGNGTTRNIKSSGSSSVSKG